MSDLSKIINNIYTKLEPYVHEGTSQPEFPQYSEEERAIYEKELDSMLETEEPDIELRKQIKDDLLTLFEPVDEDEYKKEYLKIRTEILISSLSETLRWAYKNGEQPLRDCLLPINLGRTERAWNTSMEQIGCTQEEIEKVLLKFGKNEILDRLKFPFGGHVLRTENGYVLKGPSKDNDTK